jgi:biopolymer transport protein ExbD
MRKALRKAPEEDPEFQIAPMIDVLLVLLVFFMSISTTEVLQSVAGINLAVAKEADQPKKAPGQVIVNVKWDPVGERGTVNVSDKDYPNVNDIMPILQRTRENNPAMRVPVRADRNTKYEFTRSVMLAVSQADVSNITFSVVDKEIPQ